MIGFTSVRLEGGSDNGVKGCASVLSSFEAAQPHGKEGKVKPQALRCTGCQQDKSATKQHSAVISVAEQ